MKAIKLELLFTWSSLTVALISRHLHKSERTTFYHLVQTQKNVRNTHVCPLVLPTQQLIFLFDPTWISNGKKYFSWFDY